MAPIVGTYDISSLLSVRFQSIDAFGIDTVVQVLKDDLAAHNAIVQEMMADLCFSTVDTQGIYGTGTTGEMNEVDEYGRTETQKQTPGAPVAWPLRLFQFAVGWTAKYMEIATPADLALQQIDAEKAHMKALRRDVKRAIYGSANYTYIDHLINNYPLLVKRFVNADSAAIPDAPDGSTFNASSHTHYDASATLTTAVVDAAITDLIEHGHGGRVKLAIHYSNAAAFAALTGFVAALPQYIQVPAYNVATPSVRTDLGNQYNRLVGYYNTAEVWVKPWAIAGYMFLWDSASNGKPLAYRQRNTLATRQGLRLAAELPDYPLYAKYYEAEFGIGQWVRTNGVVVQFTNASYQDPVIT